MSEQHPFPPSAQGGYPPPGPQPGGYPPPPAYPPAAQYPGMYGQQPGFSPAGFPSPPTRNRTPLIIGLVAAGFVMVLVVALGAVLVLTRGNGGSGDSGGSGDTGGPAARASSAGAGSGKPSDGQTVEAPGLYKVTFPAGFKVSKQPEAPTFLTSASGPGGNVTVSNWLLFVRGGGSLETQEALEAAVLEYEKALLGTVAETQRPTIDGHLAVLYVGTDTTRAHVLVTGNQTIRLTCTGDLTAQSQANTKRMCTEALATVKVG